MAKAIKFAIVAVCLACILLICIAPSADLPATSLRSYQMAVMLLWSLLAIAFSLLLSVLKPLSRIRTMMFELIGRERWQIDVRMQFFPVLRC